MGLSEIRNLLAPAAPFLLFPVDSDRISEKGTKGANKGFTTKDGTLRFYFEETRMMYVLDKEKNRRVRMNERQGLKCVLKNWIIYVLTYVTDKNVANEQVDVEEDEDEMPSVNSAAIDFVNSIVANLPHDKRNTRKIDEVSGLVGSLAEAFPVFDEALPEATNILNNIAPLMQGFGAFLSKVCED